MYKTIAFAAGLLALAALPARAEVIDISTIKCADLATMNADDGSYLLIWLHGYYGGKAGDTTIDMESFEAAGKEIGEACAASPDLGLMTVINQIEADNQQ
jgi:acid stress chaperone HdeB